MRIGIAGWITALGPSGVTRRLEALTEATARLGAEPVFLLPPGLEPPPGVLACGARVARVPITAAPTWRRIRQERRELPRLVRELELDLLHLPHAPAHRLPIPQSVTVHDLRDFTGWSRPGRRLLAPILWSRSLARADLLLAVSRATAAEIGRHLPHLSPRIRLVPSALPERFFTPPPAPAPAHIPGGAIITTGRPLPHKNPAVAAAALALLHQRRPASPPLVWIGPLDDPRARRAAAALRRECRRGPVLLPGPCREEELPAIYAQAKMALFPSLYEGQGLGPLEAMAAGTPVLLSRIPAHLECAGPGGELFDPRDHRELARLLEELLDDPERLTGLAARGRELARRFRPRHMAAALARAWSSIAGGDLEAEVEEGHETRRQEQVDE